MNNPCFVSGLRLRALSLTKKNSGVKSWVQKSGESWRRSLEMDKSRNGQHARSLTSQFRESTYRALTLLRRKAKQRQIAGKLYRKSFIFYFFHKDSEIFLRHRVRLQRVNLLKLSTELESVSKIAFCMFHLMINQICLVHYKIYIMKSWALH